MTQLHKSVAEVQVYLPPLPRRSWLSG